MRAKIALLANEHARLRDIADERDISNGSTAMQHLP